jgi:predicted N-formylglutamate amidohydrolase
MSNSARRSPTVRRSRRRPHTLLVSCEHGGNRIPAECRPLFVGAAEVLDSHRGLDYGALESARAFGRRLGVEPVTATISRLVCDLNRSPHHRNLFSEYTRDLPPERREALLAAHYWPYRTRVEEAVAAAPGRVLHVSSHSFTPVLRGEVRRCDVGFLYDPTRPAEVRFIEAWHEALAAAAPELVLRRNYPYRGNSDALVTHLRRRYGERYAGVELEVNQKHVGTRRWRSLVNVLAATLGEAIERHAGLPR